MSSKCVILCLVIFTLNGCKNVKQIHNTANALIRCLTIPTKCFWGVTRDVGPPFFVGWLFVAPNDTHYPVKVDKWMVLETHYAVILLFDWGSKTTAQLLCYYGASLSEERVEDGERETRKAIERGPARGRKKKHKRVIQTVFWGDSKTQMPFQPKWRLWLKNPIKGFLRGAILGGGWVFLGHEPWATSSN